METPKEIKEIVSVEMDLSVAEKLLCCNVICYSSIEGKKWTEQEDFEHKKNGLIQGLVALCVAKEEEEGASCEDLYKMIRQEFATAYANVGANKETWYGTTKSNESH